jgi:hypothetical protein
LVGSVVEKMIRDGRPIPNLPKEYPWIARVGIAILLTLFWFFSTTWELLKGTIL